MVICGAMSVSVSSWFKTIGKPVILTFIFVVVVIPFPNKGDIKDPKPIESNPSKFTGSPFRLRSFAATPPGVIPIMFGFGSEDCIHGDQMGPFVVDVGGWLLLFVGGGRATG